MQSKLLFVSLLLLGTINANAVSFTWTNDSVTHVDVNATFDTTIATPSTTFAGTSPNSLWGIDGSFVYDFSTHKWTMNAIVNALTSSHSSVFAVSGIDVGGNAVWVGDWLVFWAVNPTDTIARGSVTFHSPIKGLPQNSNVPDSGSTGLLAMLPLAALAVFRRFRPR